eukprot:746687-Hanusia_phi.AAC.2
MAEMDWLFNFTSRRYSNPVIDDTPSKHDNQFYFADICAGPGPVPLSSPLLSLVLPDAARRRFYRVLVLEETAICTRVNPTDQLSLLLICRAAGGSR